jgi:hypothetical protein
MKDREYIITFNFNGHAQEAEVTEIITGKGEKQYHIQPLNELLNSDYGNQIVFFYHGKGFKYEFPEKDSDSLAYMKALIKGLKEYLRGNKLQK